MPASQHQSPKSDIEIAQAAKPRRILDVAKEKLGIAAENLDPYGHYKAKVSMDYIKSLKDKKNGKLILVTAITPTPAGEGKTTTTVGLTDALNHIGKKAMCALREPSLGPCFGMKGGAAGGGYAQVIPMEDINLHFTGDFHAITSAHNLLSALIDNHIYWGNALGIDSRRVAWRRVMDMNDRALREIVCSLGGVANGYPREAGFDITVASEVMAIFCLATDLEDLKRAARQHHRRLHPRPQAGARARSSRRNGAMTALLKDAIAPNLVQTLEGTPAFIHGGPFANIAHGCNSVSATTTALKLADYVVTEAGFGADLGAEKFLDIKCRKAGPQARLRRDRRDHPRAEDARRRQEGRPEEGRPEGARSRHGEPPAPRRERQEVRPAGGGLDQPLLGRHRRRDRAGQGEVQGARRRGADGRPLGDGRRGRGRRRQGGGQDHRRGQGEAEVALSRRDAAVREDPHHRKEIYRADDATADKSVKDQLKQWEDMGFGKLPVCIAKTQYSFSTNPDAKGAPKRLLDPGARGAAFGRRRVHRGDLRRDHDHAGPAQGAGGRLASMSTTQGRIVGLF